MGNGATKHLNAQKQGMARQMGAGCRRNIPFYFSIDHGFLAERMVISHPFFRLRTVPETCLDLHRKLIPMREPPKREENVKKQKWSLSP